MAARDGEPVGFACFREAFLGGMRAGTGLGAVVFILGLTFGALARAHGWGLSRPWPARLSSSQALRSSRCWPC